jgi:hypothetical protein
MNEQSLQNLFNDGMLVDLTVSYWSAARKLREEDIGLEEVSKAYSLGKKLLIPYEVMHEFKLIESRARALIDDSSYKFPIGNARFIPKKKFIGVVEDLRKLQDRYKELVIDLITNYDAYREKMRPIYEAAALDAFNTKSKRDGSFQTELLQNTKEVFIQEFMRRINACYPSVDSLAAKFDINLSVFEVTLPKLHESDASNVAHDMAIHTELANEYRRQMQTKISTFVNDAVSVLRQEAIELCRHVSTNIAEGKVIKSTTINSLTTFIDKFKDMNFAGDKTVEQSLESLRKEILDANPAGEFTNNEDLKVELQRRLNLIVEQASDVSDINSVSGEYRRKINWE